MKKLQTLSTEGELKESLTEFDWAWLAGIIDGEGHLGIRRGYADNKNKNKRAISQDGWAWHSPRISVNNTHIPAMKKASAMLDGVLIVRKPVQCNYSLIYGVEVSARDKLLKFLPKLIPYMVIKKEIAELILEFCKLPRGSGIEKEKLYNDAVILSQVETDRTFSPRGLERCNGQD